MRQYMVLCYQANDDHILMGDEGDQDSHAIGPFPTRERANEVCEAVDRFVNGVQNSTIQHIVLEIITPDDPAFMWNQNTIDRTEFPALYRE